VKFVRAEELKELELCSYHTVEMVRQHVHSSRHGTNIGLTDRIGKTILLYRFLHALHADVQ